MFCLNYGRGGDRFLAIHVCKRSPPGESPFNHLTLGNDKLYAVNGIIETVYLVGNVAVLVAQFNVTP